MRKKKVTFVLSGYGKYDRGAEKLVASLASQLRTDFDVTVLGGAATAPCAVAIPVIDRHHPVTKSINRTPLLGHALRTFQIDPLNIEWMSSMWSAHKWLKDHPSDLLIPEGGRWGGMLGAWYRKKTGAPFLDIAHGAFSRWEQSALRYNPDCYVVPTAVAAETVRSFGVQTRVISPGVDTDLFSPEGDCIDAGLKPPVVMAVGAFEPLKRFDYAIDLVHEWGQGSLLLVGHGPERARLIEHGNTRLGPERFLCRSAKPDEMPGLYRSANVLVSPSRSEAFGLVYLEALACGLPVVTVDNDVRREVLGNTGFYCSMSGFEECIQQLEKALSQDAGKNRERALQFSIEKMATSYRTLLNELLEINKPL